MNKAFVINLDSAEKEFQEVQQAFLPFGIERERFVVTPDGNKQIGCTMGYFSWWSTLRTTQKTLS